MFNLPRSPPLGARSIHKYIHTCRPIYDSIQGRIQGRRGQGQRTIKRSQVYIPTCLYFARSRLYSTGPYSDRSIFRQVVILTGLQVIRINLFIYYIIICLYTRARILVQVTIHRRLLIGRDGRLDQSEAYDVS